MSPRPADGTLRQRRPDTWEIRVYVGTDPVSGKPRQRSVTVHGDLATAQQARAQLAAHATQWRATRNPPLSTVHELLHRWISSEHDWKPSTWQNYRQAARRLSEQPLAGRDPLAVSPPVLRAAMRTVLVSQGRILHAQQRLGHRDASTTLRQYCHALPLEDLDVADTLEQVYRPR